MIEEKADSCCIVNENFNIHSQGCVTLSKCTIVHILSVHYDTVCLLIMPSFIVTACSNLVIKSPLTLLYAPKGRRGHFYCKSQKSPLFTNRLSLFQNPGHFLFKQFLLTNSLFLTNKFYEIIFSISQQNTFFSFCILISLE